ncbi:hypothetical protein [Novipirellula artificiosorum]|uniref:Uncharacterized protein n=1 Tax=Novipirellula artificiosorum TaxID=2528016 RepID=A0A5C6DWP6_9BACT|nr:hypothetical protein [Novipirellula artificiosorum]TWU40805.1 hypothetical protein Poly41_16400 [Novipirellula artificiosorum]
MLRRWVIVLSAIFVSIVLFLLIRVQGAVAGREFSPVTFAMREFRFYEIPLIHLQITPIRRTRVTTKTATYLRQNSLINAPTQHAEIWHLVDLSRGFTGQTPADAKILVDQLTLKHEGGEYWRQWCIDHPKHAKLFWPRIQRLAGREMYLLMPPLFELAQTDQSAEAMSQKVDDSLRLQYRDLILDLRAADRDELANGILLEARQDFPNDVELNNL